MILIVGAAASGKLNYVGKLGYAPEQIAHGVLDDKPVFEGLETWLLKPESWNESLYPRLIQKEVIVCNEVGGGIVPLNLADREWRDQVGRLCVRLAGDASRVIRVVCGQAQTLKDTAAL